MTFPKIDVAITTVYQLVNYGTSVAWGMRSGTYLEEYLKETDIEKFVQLYAHADFYQDENDEIIERVRGGKYVYIDWKTNLRYIMKREFLKTDRCDFSLGTDDFMVALLADLPIK